MILDTDMLIALAQPNCPEQLAERLAGARGRLCTTAVNWGEICHGLARISEDRARRLRGRYESILASEVAILDFDWQAAEIFGELRASLEQLGQRLDNVDLMIAAIARRHDMTLVTGNTRHFARVPGLKLENWLEE